jgi:hypothetical protein
MPMMPFIGVGSVAMLARNCLRATGLHRAVAGVTVLVGDLEPGVARPPSAQAVLLQEEPLIARLDVGQHRIELSDQLADFVRVAVGADVVAATVSTGRTR